MATGASGAGSPAERAVSGRYKVLVVEDDALLALGIVNQLARRAGRYTVCGVAATEEEAVRLAAEHQPDLAVVDIRLKAGDGVEAARMIRSHYATSILFASAYCEAERQRMPEGSWCLAKPFQPTDIVDALDTITRIRRGEEAGLMPEGLHPI